VQVGRAAYFVQTLHDRYQHKADGWEFTEPVCGFKYVDNSPLPGSAPDTTQEGINHE